MFAEAERELELSAEENKERLRHVSTENNLTA